MRNYAADGIVMAGAMDLLSVEDTARMLGVSARRVRVFISAGRLSAMRVGARTFAVDRAEAERFARLPRVGGRPPRRARLRHPAGDTGDRRPGTPRRKQSG